MPLQTIAPQVALVVVAELPVEDKRFPTVAQTRVKVAKVPAKEWTVVKTARTKVKDSKIPTVARTLVKTMRILVKASKVPTVATLLALMETRVKVSKIRTVKAVQALVKAKKLPTRPLVKPAKIPVRASKPPPIAAQLYLTETVETEDKTSKVPTVALTQTPIKTTKARIKVATAEIGCCRQARDKSQRPHVLSGSKRNRVH